ncbi:MAG: hypothetical protein ACRC6D_08460, partial [Aeromonas sp.]
AELKTAPRFRHMTEALKIAAEVQDRYWGDGWMGDTTKPKQFTILSEIVNEHGVSKLTAQAIERVACPFTRDPARKNKK